MNESDMFLPVELLTQNVIEYIEDLSDLLEDLKHECDGSNLSKVLEFERIEGVDRNVACIKKDVSTGEYKIYMNVNFAQYMWSVGLYLLVIFDNKIHIPMMDKAGCNDHGYVANEDACSEAADIYKRARTLMYKFDRDIIWQKPNMREYDYLGEYVKKANSVYCAAMAFIYAHEFAHHYLGHTLIDNDYSRAVDDEKAADETALDYVLKVQGEKESFTYKMGILVSLIAILFIDVDYLSGGATHPNMDERIRSLISKFNLADEDNLWGVAALAISMFVQSFNLVDDVRKLEEEEFETYKDMYDYYLHLLEDIRKSRYPKIYKKEWEQ